MLRISAKNEKIEKTEKFETIKSLFNPILEEEQVRIFRFIQDGPSYGSSKRTKRSARVSIQIPKEICDENLKTLRNWKMYVVAIPIEVIDNLKD